MINIQAWVSMCNILTTFQMNESLHHWLCYFHIENIMNISSTTGTKNSFRKHLCSHVDWRLLQTVNFRYLLCYKNKIIDRDYSTIY